ncbi:hypothetical protein AG1IA_07984 [Rhizoctonia solani AG-1 IA]|uniref:Uncharacterized protein n=1 Tax=Thanatephorus cucumeris (strain AG1-IA) TaxID=983506 RepID=L8WIE6_THACA|nr:hypothetical protein AG1IA_07984 [Rhizoctonia solani AG-1 IA]
MRRINYFSISFDSIHVFGFVSIVVGQRYMQTRQTIHKAENQTATHYNRKQRNGEKKTSQARKRGLRPRLGRGREGGSEMAALRAYILRGLSGSRRASSSSSYARLGNEFCDCLETCMGAEHAGFPARYTAPPHLVGELYWNHSNELDPARSLLGPKLDPLRLA